MEDTDFTRLPEDRIVAIRNALFRGSKIEAIKHYREATGLGLAESKSFVEALEVRLRAEEPEQFSRDVLKAGCAGVLAIAGLTSGLAGWWF